MTSVPISNYSHFTSSWMKDGAESQPASVCRRLTSPTIGSADSTGHAIRNDELQVDDICHYSGTFDWLGRCVAVTQNHALLLDWEGRICRIPLAIGETHLLARIESRNYWSHCPAATSVAAVTGLLIGYTATAEAVMLARKAEFDPADFDQWMLPISLFIVTQHSSLQPEAKRYYKWPAYVRRNFEAALDMMQGERQREVYIRNVLAGVPTGQLRREYGLGKSAIRTARWRALTHLRHNLPHVYGVGTMTGRGITA